MARRSYLSRIAEPLRVGDPVLFAVPQAAPEEARPHILAGQPKALRRAVVGPERVPAEAGTPPRVAAMLQAPMEAPMQVRGAPEGASLPIAPPSAREPVAAAVPRRQMDPSAPRVQPEAAPTALPFVPGAMRDMPSLPRHADVTAEPADAAGPDRSLPSAPLQAGTTESFRGPLRLEPAASSPQAAVAAPPQHPSEPAAVAAQRSPVASTASAAPPRLHIGTIEVRSTTPQPPPSAPSPASGLATPGSAVRAPLARGYGWPFGLAQG
jgi:hypothetical protein